MSSASSTSLLDEILDKITRHPKNLLVLVLLVGGVAFSTASVLIGFVTLLLIGVSRLPFWIASALGLVLLGLAWLLDGVSFAILHQQNQLLWSEALHGGFATLQSLYVWLCAIPAGVVLGSVLAAIVQMQTNLHAQIRRTAQGKLAPDQKFISDKQVQKALGRLQTSAYATGTVLGVERITGEYVTLDDSDANLHTLAIGTTGSGKTTAIGNIIESAIHRHWPLFYVDGKGDLELAHKVRAMAASHGVPFYLFSMVGESCVYNPIAFGGFTSKKDRIVELRTWTEDHYRKLAEGYLQTVFKILERAGVAIDLCSLARHLEPKALYMLARSLNDSALADEIELLQERRKDIQSLIAEIENIANSEIGHLFDCSRGGVVTLDQVLAERGVIYFCLQPLAFPAYAETLGKLIINDLKALLASQLQVKEKIKLFAIFDEFSIFAGDQIVNLINQGRGAGVHAVLATQSLSDIQRKGGDALLGQVLNNCNNYIIQRQNYPEDAEVLASIIGTCDSFQVTSQAIVGGDSSGAASVRQTKEFIVHPDEIKRLGRGEGVFVNKQGFRVGRVVLRKGLI